METENLNQYRNDKYSELSKKSLVRVQYSCSGNDNSSDEEEYIPIVTTKKTENENETQNS